MSSLANAAAGGALIGTAAAGLLLVNGRIAGISGILGNAMNGRPGLWRWTFLAGLVASAFLAPRLGIVGSAPKLQTGWLGLVVAGLLVGIGTKIGSGCTSGHGVCGIANLSPRSLVATLTFVSVAMATVYAVHHLRN